MMLKIYGYVQVHVAQYLQEKKRRKCYSTNMAKLAFDRMC